MLTLACCGAFALVRHRFNPVDIFQEEKNVEHVRFLCRKSFNARDISTLMPPYMWGVASSQACETTGMWKLLELRDRGMKRRRERLNVWKKMVCVDSSSKKRCFTGIVNLFAPEHTSLTSHFPSFLLSYLCVFILPSFLFILFPSLLSSIDWFFSLLIFPG